MKKYIVYGEPGIPAKRVALLYGVNLKDCILVPYYDIKSTLGLDKSKYIELYPDMTNKYDLPKAELDNLGIAKKINEIKKAEIEDINKLVQESFIIKIY